MRQVRDRFREVLERMPVWGVVIGSDGTVQSANARFVQGTGWAREQLTGSPWIERCIPADARDRARAVLEVFARTGETPPDFDGVLIDSSGARHRVRWTFAGAGDGGESGSPAMVWMGEPVGGTGFRTPSMIGNDGDLDYRALFTSLREGFALHEVRMGGQEGAVDFRFIHVNPAFEQLVGLEASRVIGRSVHEILPEGVPSWRDAYRQVVLTGESARFERHVPGLNRWFEISAFVAGERHLAAVFVDVSERRKARDRLLQHDAELEAIFNNAPGIQLLVAEDGTLRRVNRAALEYFGLTEEEALGRRAGDFISCLNALKSPAGCGSGDHCHTCRLRTAVTESLQQGKVHRRLEVRKTLLRKGAAYEATLLVSSSQVLIGGQLSVLVCLEDVTTSRLAEDRIREQAALLAAAHDAICVLDLEGRIRFWNKGAERLYGWTADEALGEEAAKIVFGGSRMPWARVRQIVLEEELWDGELQQYRRDNQPLVVEARGSLVRDARGSPKSILMVATDVTEKRQLERQVFRGQRLESLGTLACGIAHDLNNVLTPVQMVADLLRPSVAGTEGERFLELLGRSARRGADIIKQLLVFGRGVEGSRIQMDLRFLLKETATILGETFPKSIQVRLELANSLWPVIADATQLHQVVLNLCVNARDAMPGGGVLRLAVENVVLTEDDVRADPEARPGRYVVIRVADTGTGIAPEVFDRIFDPFFTTKPQGQGTGLGLSTVQGIVRSHKGFVRVTTKVGAGSVFSVHIPAGTEPVDEVRSAAPTPALPGAQQWILVADDEDAIRELVRATLERAGYQVITAGDGAEAISIFGRRHTEIAAVVIDMMMPFIDGAAAITMLRRLKPTIPIIAVSGLPSQREEAERASDGQVIFLQKPFPMKDLVSELTRCLPAGTLRRAPVAGGSRGD